MKIENISSYLQDKYKPKAIILHGSRFSGDAGPESDYDITLVCENTENVRPEEYQGLSLDVSAATAEAKYLEARNTPIWPCKILFDDEDMLGKILVLRTEQAWQDGPPPLTSDEFENRKNYINRLLQRLKDRGDVPLSRYYYLADFYERVIRYWFEFDNNWMRPIYKAIPHIEKQDPAFYKSLEKLWGDDYFLAATDICHRLFDKQHEN